MSDSRIVSDPEYPTITGLADANHVSVALILAALGNAQIWEIVGGGPAGPGGPAALSAEGKNYLSDKLEETFSAVLQKGNVGAAVFATYIALCKARLM